MLEHDKWCCGSIYRAAYKFMFYLGDPKKYVEQVINIDSLSTKYNKYITEVLAVCLNLPAYLEAQKNLLNRLLILTL